MTNQMHTIDVPPEHLDAIEAGDMTFAVAKSGDYHIGDTVILHGHHPIDGYVITQIHGATLRREIYRRVTYVLQGGQFGIETGYVVLGLEKLPLAQAR